MRLNWLPAVVAATIVQTSAIGAVSSSDTAMQVVHSADLDLSRPQDLRAFDRRLDRAVARVCGLGSPVDPRRVRHMLECRHDTRARLDPQRDRALAAADTGHGPQGATRAVRADRTVLAIVPAVGSAPRQR